MHAVMQYQQASHRPRSQGGAPHNKRVVVGKGAGTVPPAWRTTVAQVRQRYYDRWPRDFGVKYGPTHERQDPRPVVIGSKILMSQLPLDSVYERDIEVKLLTLPFWLFC